MFSDVSFNNSHRYFVGCVSQNRKKEESAIKLLYRNKIPNHATMVKFGTLRSRTINLSILQLAFYLQFSKKKIIQNYVTKQRLL